jgi:hypothetical protein
MLGMYDGNQDVELFLNLSKRYANGEIVMVGQLENAFGLITGVGYAEDENGNATLADWNFVSAVAQFNEEVYDLGTAQTAVYAFSYKDGKILFGYDFFELRKDYARYGDVGEWIYEAKNSAINESKDYTDGEIEEVKDYVDKEIATFDFIKVVQNLPTTGLPNRFYLVPKTTATDNDFFDEYVWVNKGTEENPEYVWEFQGTKKVEVDLTDYVKKYTDTGLFKAYGVDASGNQVMHTLSTSDSSSNTENRIPVFRPLATSGQTEINMALVTGVPEQPYQAANKKYVDDITGDIETALDNIIAIQNSLIGG